MFGKSIFVGCLLLLWLSKGKSQSIEESIDYNDKYCNQGNCLTYYDGCNYCGCDLECIQITCEEYEEDYCVSCESNMIWNGDCAPVASTTCNEVVTGVYLQHILECQQKCTCPDDKPYWNETHCVTKNDCYNADINTIIPAIPTPLPTTVPIPSPPISPPTMTPPISPPTIQPTPAGPTMSPPISPPSIQPTAAGPTMTPPISPPTVRPTPAGPTMSPPISGPTNPPVVVDYFPSHAPTKPPTTRPTRQTRRPTARPTIV